MRRLAFLLVLCSVYAGASVSYTNCVAGTITGTSGSCSVSTHINDVILVSNFACKNTGFLSCDIEPVPTISDGVNTYANLISANFFSSAQSGPNPNHTNSVFCAVATTTASITVTATYADPMQFTGLQVVSITGITPTCTPDATHSDAANSNTPTSTVTAVAAGTFLFAMEWEPNAGGTTVTTGTLIGGGSGDQQTAFLCPTGPAGSHSVTWNTAGTGTWNALGVTITGAGNCGSASVRHRITGWIR